MILPVFSALNLIGQVSNNSQIDVNWLLNLAVVVVGFFMVMQLKELKSDVKGNTSSINSLKIDVARIKERLGIKGGDEDLNWKE